MKDGRQYPSPEYKTLFNSIPGGVQQCLNDEYFTLIEVNQGFIDMFGFGWDEIGERFQYRFIEMIHPDDRQSVLDEVSEQLKSGEKSSQSYRVLCRDGSCKWVMDNARLISTDGEEQLLCVMMDVTETRNAREELRLSLERHRIIMDQTTDIIFEWNMLADTMIYSANWGKKFGYEPVHERILESLKLRSHIHPDDLHRFQQLIADARSGKPYSTDEFRIQDAKGNFIWCRIRATDQYDASGNPIKAVGVITDIDKEKRLIDNLKYRAERDALTGLYNREETVTQIRCHLQDRPECCGALFMIDTDNFKQVNDSQGHLFGDAVLAELASGMKRLTRGSDIVGRIGGDEFTVFLKDVPDRKLAERKAELFLDMFRHLFEDEKQNIAFSCSIGVAMYPEDGSDFQSLYHCADLALYQAKSRGKNQYVIYEPGQSVPVQQPAFSSLGAAIDSDERGTGTTGDLANYVFQILYDTKDIDQAINLILEIVGKRFDVSRAYIFENSDDGKYSYNTYEWCNAGITPEKENLQQIPYADLEGYENLFGENAIFYCRDIHALAPSQVALFERQGIRSTLQCAIRSEDESFRGFVGFDECTGTRLWTKDEIAILSLVSQLLTTFLQKKRATDRDRQLAVQLNTILDVQDAYIYAIRRDTYELLYLNHKTKELALSAKPGMPCYKAFFRKEEPCEKCPLRQGGPNEIYNPIYNVWTKVHVTPMHWGDSPALLLSCYDITEYKKMEK